MSLGYDRSYVSEREGDAEAGDADMGDKRGDQSDVTLPRIVSGDMKMG